MEDRQTLQNPYMGEEEMIKKVKGGWVIVHCHKKGMIGKRISATKKPVSYKKALAIHRAIILSEKRRRRR